MKSIYILCFMLFAFFSNAQDNPKVIVFKSEDSKVNSSPQSNILRVGVFEIVNGDFSLYYERKVAEKLSLQFGLGVTIQDYFGGLLNDDIDFLLESDVQAKVGHSLSAGFRFYPSGALEDFYFAPEIKYRKYQWDDNTYNGPDPETQTRSYAIPRLNIGYVWYYDNSVNFDLFAGFGFAKIKNNAYETTYDPITFQAQTEMTEREALRPRFHIGFSIGFAF